MLLRRRSLGPRPNPKQRNLRIEVDRRRTNLGDAGRCIRAGAGPDFEKISTNPTSGDVYVVAAFVKGNAADGGIQVFFTRSTDHGASFSSPVQISAHDEGAWAWDAYATAGVDPGTVYVTYGVGASTNHQFSGYDRIFIAKSTDGGMT